MASSPCSPGVILFREDCMTTATHNPPAPIATPIQSPGERAYMAGPRAERNPLSRVIVMRAPEIRVTYRGNGPKQGDELIAVHEYPLLLRLYRQQNGTVTIPDEQNPLPFLRTVREYTQSQWDAEMDRLNNIYSIPMERGTRNLVSEVYGVEGLSTLAAKARQVFAAFRTMADNLKPGFWLTKDQVKELIAIVEPTTNKGAPLLLEDGPFTDPNRPPIDSKSVEEELTADLAKAPLPASKPELLSAETRQKITLAASAAGMSAAKIRQFLQAVERVGSANFSSEDWNAAHIEPKDRPGLLKAYAEALA